MIKKIRLVSIMCLLILIEQFIKIQIEKNLYNKTVQIINNILKLKYVQNTGGAFSIGANAISIIIILNIIVISIMIFILFNNKQKYNKLNEGCITIVIAGGISNLIDRIFRGYVIDYIDITRNSKFSNIQFSRYLYCIRMFSISCRSVL